ncbi:hypothetical protein ACLB2K_001726 [Fragaria x ananassa]
MKIMAKTSSSGDILAPIFSGENYDFWRIKMRTVFITHDLWSLVKEGYIVPEDVAALSAAEKLALKSNIKRDSKALGVIQNAVTDEIFASISNEETTNGAWEVLQDEFRGSA